MHRYNCNPQFNSLNCSEKFGIDFLSLPRFDLMHPFSPKYGAADKRKREYRYSREIIIIALGRGVGVTLEIRVISYRDRQVNSALKFSSNRKRFLATLVRRFNTAAFSMPRENLFRGSEGL